MQYDVVGKLYHVYDTVQRTETFKTRDVVLEVEGRKTSQYVTFQFVQDGCAQLDMFKEGETVKIEFGLSGRYHKPSERFFTNLSAWRITPLRGKRPPGPPSSSREALYGDYRPSA